MKKIIYSALALLLFGAATAKAQDTVETTVGTDFVSSYVWRGLELGDVSMQPTLGVSYKGLSLSAWGSVGLSNPADTKELDLTLAYSVGGFNIGVTDYWFNAGLDPLNRYFKYAADETNHVFEANVGYDFGFASLQWYTNFAGNDLPENWPTAVILRSMSRSRSVAPTGRPRSARSRLPRISMVRAALHLPIWH